MKRLILLGLVALLAGGVAAYLRLRDASREKRMAQEILVQHPRSYQRVTSPLRVRGQAVGSWFFEASFPIELMDAGGRLLGRAPATARGEWMTSELVPFTAELTFEHPVTPAGLLRIRNDNPSGLAENSRSLDIPVAFRPADLRLKLFFGNSRLDPQGLECDRTYPVTRVPVATQLIAELAMRQLLAGPSEDEGEEGFFTSLPPQAKLRGVTLEDGTATVDFSAEMNRVAGSCRVAAIRAQITQTIMQLPGMKEVIISVDGQTEEALQP